MIYAMHFLTGFFNFMDRFQLGHPPPGENPAQTLIVITTDSPSCSHFWLFALFPFSLVYSDCTAAGPSSMVYIRFMWVLYVFHARRFVPIGWYELVQPFSTFCPFLPFSPVYSDSTAAGPSLMVYIHFMWVLYVFHARRFVPIGWYELVQPFSTFHPFSPFLPLFSHFYRFALLDKVLNTVDM